MRFGDYIAIAKTNKAILDDNDDILKKVFDVQHFKPIIPYYILIIIIY